MPDSPSQDPNEDKTDDSVDLSQLKSFSFGTQWTEASKSSSAPGKPRFHKGGRSGGEGRDRRPSGAARKDRRPPRPPRGDGPVGAGQEAGGAEAGGHRPRRRGGPRFEQGGRRPAFQPYESPVFDVCFYPEDNCFSAIIKAMRANHLTYELFHVAKLFMEKPDRFIASITRKAEKGQKPEKVTICALDNMPFATEEEAIAHAMAKHSDAFFETEEVEVEPPSGNFPFVNRCPFTKELLGPPNYHKYEETLRNHHRTRLPNMPFEKLQSSIETVREEEAVNQWLESQKTATRYKAKEVKEGEEPKTFASFDEAMGHLRTQLKSRIVKQVNYARVHGSALEENKDTEAYKAAQGERERQLRFPLDTANAIRGRMRREKFSIYKKGSKGVTYVCATKRNFRSPGQAMSPDLDRIIRFLEANQNIKAKEMPAAYEAWLSTESPEESFDEKKLTRDLHWLIADGYVSHFEDDTLFAQPVLEAGAQGGDEKPPAKVEAPKEAPAADLRPAEEGVSKVEKAAEAAEPAASSETPPAAAPQASATSAEESTEAATVSEPTDAAKAEAPPAEATPAETAKAVPEAEPVAPTASAPTEETANPPETPASSTDEDLPEPSHEGSAANAASEPPVEGDASEESAKESTPSDDAPKKDGS